MSGRTYDGTRHLMPLFAPADAPSEVLRGLLEGHDCLYPVARRDADALPSKAFSLSDSPDDADYLYAATQFADYPGRALAAKRNQVRQLLTSHVLSAEPFSEAWVAAGREMLRGWMLQKGKAEGEADEAACIEALDHAARFGLEGFIHFANGMPAGFVLAQELQPGVCRHYVLPRASTATSESIRTCSSTSVAPSRALLRGSTSSRTWDCRASGAASARTGLRR